MTDFHVEGGDLLSQDAIRSIVREIYGGVTPPMDASPSASTPEEIASLPEETVRIALGVGHPVRHADLKPGEDVVDLGSGGGIDCLIAARAVGPAGSVVGVDFLGDMVARATRAATEAGIANARFVEGLMEDIPLADGSVDVVISNGVINLSPRKVRVLAEACRILRPGGRLAMVDLALEHDLPAEIQTIRRPGPVVCRAPCPRSPCTRSPARRLSRGADRAARTLRHRRRDALSALRPRDPGAAPRPRSAGTPRPDRDACPRSWPQTVAWRAARRSGPRLARYR